jgi:hypothetical protein
MLSGRSIAFSAGLSASTLSSQGSVGQGNAGWKILTTQDEAGALVLPSVPRVSVLGTLSAAITSRVVEIPSDPRTLDLGIELSTTSPTGVPLEMALFDASGRKIADSEPSSGPDPRVLAMNVPVDQLTQSPGVYVKIAAPPGSLGSPSSSEAVLDSFVLEVTRDPGTGWLSSTLAQDLTPPVHLGNGSSSLVLVVPQSAFEAEWEYSSPAPVGSGQAETAVGGSLLTSSALTGQQPLALPALATGPLPERAGAPLGGVLAEGDPVPQIDRQNPALVDLALIGLPEPEPLPGLGASNVEAILAELGPARQEPEGSVPIRGPGGFPLLASSLHGERAQDSRALVAVLPPLSPVVTLASAEHAEEVVPTATVTEQRRKPIRTVSMVSGLSVAMAMVFNLALPDMSQLMTIVAAPRFRLRFRLRRRRRDRV